MIRPEEIEPLSNYNILTNDDSNVLLMLPGYFKGEPLIAEIRYHGGEEIINENTLKDVFGVTAHIVEMEGKRGIIYEE